jgi:hypothetical protein
MNQKSIFKTLPLAFLFCLSIILGTAISSSGCSSKDGKPQVDTTAIPTISVTPSPSPEPATPSPSPTPSSPYAVNPFTGLYTMDPANVGKRSVTVSINNHPESLPSRGLSRADAIYEFETEGGQTRLLALYADAAKIPEVGSIRSARIVACDLSAGTNSIFIHYGENGRVPDYVEYNKIDEIDGNNYSASSGQSVDGQITLSNGIYFWRDSVWKSKRAIEHTAVSNGTHIVRAIEALGYSLDGETPSLFNFTETSSPSLVNGTECNTLVVYFSSGNDDSTFTYNPLTKVYAKSQYNGKAQIDETTGEQISVTNVFTLFANIQPHGDKTVDVYFADGGTGYYASEGKIIEILWTKEKPHSVISVTDLDGNPIQVNAGKCYINVVRETKADKTSWS